MPSAGGGAGPVTEGTKPCPLHSCRRRTCLIIDKVPAVTSRPALLPGAAKRSWPVAPIAELAGRRVLRLTAAPHLDHRPSPGARIFRLRTELSAWKQPAGWPGPWKARGEAIVAAFQGRPVLAPSAGGQPGIYLAGFMRATYWQLPGRRQSALTLGAAPGPMRLPTLPECPGWDVALGSVAGRRWQPPSRPGSSSSRPGISRPARSLGFEATVRRGRDTFQRG